ncbi:MAG: DnaJ domain-containing protein [Halobacteriaceae archaeon]
MRPSPYLVVLAGIFALIAVVFGILGVLYSPISIGVGIPFAIVAVIFWLHGSGRLHRYVRSRAQKKTSREDTTSQRRQTYAQPNSSQSLTEARNILDVSRHATEEEIKQAYRQKVKEVHPDQDGSREKFEQLNKAYETLLEHSQS